MNLNINNIIYLPGKIHVSQIEGLTDYSSEYLTFKALEDCIFNCTKGTSYSIDNGITWLSLAANLDTPVIRSGNKIMWKSNLTPTSSNGIGTFSSTGNFNVEGNPLSLLYRDNFAGQADLTGEDYTFFQLFYNCSKLINAKNLSLPATTLTNNCYECMFKDCTSLIAAPELPATALATNCYEGMFDGCTSLTSAPELPAITLERYCYIRMFQGCTNLTAAPKLPATTLANNCYKLMFENCTSLIFAPELPATTLATNCYEGMFLNCVSLSYAPELPATTLASYCYSQMFEGCTSLITAPELPATTLPDYCYASMFYNCTSLTAAPELPTTEVPDYCYASMFYNCTSLTTAPKLPAIKLGDNCYEYMFYGCTSLTIAPELPATTLATQCYYYMFYDCTSLIYIKMLATDITARYCLDDFINDRNIGAYGIFVKNYKATWTEDSFIPGRWEVFNDDIYEYYETSIYGVSSTVATDSSKKVVIPGIKNLNIGQTIIVMPQYTGSVIRNLTLTLNNFNPYEIRLQNQALNNTMLAMYWCANDPTMFVFDGSYWQIIKYIK